MKLRCKPKYVVELYYTHMQIAFPQGAISQGLADSNLGKCGARPRTPVEGGTYLSRDKIGTRSTTVYTGRDHDRFSVSFVFVQHRVLALALRRLSR